MTERLRQLINDYVVKAGKNAMAKLSVESDVSLRTLYLIRNEGHVTSANNVLKIAVACGLSEEDALELAKDSAPPEEAKDTA